MANIAIPTTFAPSTVAQSAQVNANFSEVATKFNTYAVQTDVAKTIAVSHTQAADMLFTDALYDIGKSGATRPRDGFFSRNLTVSGTTAVQALTATTITASSGIRHTGGQTFRIENTYGARPVGSTGVGVDLGVSGVNATIEAWNSSTGAAAALLVSGASVTLNAVAVDVVGNLRLSTNGTYLRGTTSGAVTVNVFSLTADPNNITRFIAGVDAGGFQWTNQAQTVGWASMTAATFAVTGNITGTTITGNTLVATVGGASIVGDLTFTDALYDIGKSGVTRPRDGFFSRNLVVGGTLSAGTTTVTGAAATGTLAIDSTTGAVSDVAQLLFKRGGVTKWSMGNNLDGINIDDFSLYAGATNVMSASSTSFSIQNAVAFNVSGQTTLSTTSTGNLTVTGSMSATGRITTAASAAGGAGFRLPHGAAPTIPVDGDMWTTAAGGAFIRINGVTKTFTLT